MRCWQCGVEPLTVVDTTTLGSPFTTRAVSRWPIGDHEHAEHPPTPEELEREGHRSLRRILEAM